MAILSNGKFYGFLCSAKETGRKLANGVKEYVEDFVSGFTGHGWRLWEYVKGKWKLEIDTIVVRETMLVFEMLISKIRAIIGAQTISQGHGKIKSVSISDDGTEYLIVLEDEDVSIVAHDFVRCQTFTGDKTKLYHVEVNSVDVETKTLHVLLSEFDEPGNTPVAGDELVQFGNSQNKARQSAIYMHADETGQPAIDVMFDVDSKNWDGKVKVRMGGDIPGSNGLKGFYCVNGLIKCVDDKGAVVYEFAPDGTVDIGKGNIIYNPSTNKVILGSGVTLAWDNLDDESKENLKGKPGKDANILSWVENWNNNRTEIKGEYVVSPKMFSGTKDESTGKLTGIAMGRDCLTEADGTKRTGIFALVDDEIIFELDPLTKKYLFRGKVETQSSGKKIIIDPGTNTFEMRDSNGESVFTLEFIEFNGYSVPRIRLIDTTEVPGTNFHSSVSLSHNSIGLVDYDGYTPSTVGVNISSNISKLGIWFHKSGDGFILNVDSKVSDVSINGVTYHRHLTRWNPGYLPNESQANQGEIYANSDGILRVKS